MSTGDVTITLTTLITLTMLDLSISTTYTHTHTHAYTEVRAQLLGVVEPCVRWVKKAFTSGVGLESDNGQKGSSGKQAANQSNPNRPNGSNQSNNPISGSNPNRKNGSNGVNQSNMEPAYVIDGLEGLEESVWCPVLGIKGIMDGVVRTHIPPGSGTIEAHSPAGECLCVCVYMCYM